MSYADGFVLVVPKKKLKSYMAMAKKACKVWMDYGALQYCEAAGDDLDVKCGVTFPKLCKLKPTETVVFSWILYKNRKHRDQVNAKVMKDPRITGMIDPKDMPFDMKRMCFGGFTVAVYA